MLQYSYRPDPPPTRAHHSGEPQPWAPYSALPDRPPIRWPNGARIALWILPCVLHYEYMPPSDPWLNAWTRMLPPDVLGYGRQEYGNRVAFWRVLDMLDRHGARCTIVANSTALRLYPRIASAIAERQWEVLGHGQVNTRFVFGLTEDEERRYYEEMLRVVEETTGYRMKGMGGPGPQSATASTPDLLAELGFLYHSDWFYDEQPTPLRVRSGRLVTMPYPTETNDVPVLGSAFDAEVFRDVVIRQFDQLHADSAATGRVMGLCIHPFLIGQPHRIRFLDEILRHVLSHPGVWQATGAEIAEYYVAHHYEPMVAHLRAQRAWDVPPQGATR
jgi:allantoinase